MGEHIDTIVRIAREATTAAADAVSTLDRERAGDEAIRLAEEAERLLIELERLIGQ